MRYNRLGCTGLLVSELCLGTLSFGQPGGLGQPEADEIVRASFDTGVNFFDTADLYADGEAERTLGQSLRNLGLRRDEIVIATKAMARVGGLPSVRASLPTLVPSLPT